MASRWRCGAALSAGGAHESSKSGAFEGDIEFYFCLFVSYLVGWHDGVRLEFGHIFNSGLDKRNPGTEPLVLFWIHDL